MRRVLIVSLDNLGDLAFACALVPALRAARPTEPSSEEVPPPLSVRTRPDVEIGVWAKEYAGGLLSFVPGLTRVHLSDPFWDTAPGRGRGRPGPFLRALMEARRAGYDAALLPQSSWRGALAARAAAIPRRIGFSRRGRSRWLTDALPEPPPDRPVVAEWAWLLAPLGADPARAEMKLVPPAWLDAARERMRARLGPRAVAIHPFAGDERRCAAPAFWAGLIDRLRAGSARRILVVGRGEESRAFAAALPPAAREGLVFSAELGEGTLTDALLAVSLCGVFIGHDSGPLHCACGLGVPAVGLYLPGDWPRTMPQGRGPWRAIRCASPDQADPAEAAALVAEFLV